MNASAFHIIQLSNSIAIDHAIVLGTIHNITELKLELKVIKCKYTQKIRYPSAFELAGPVGRGVLLAQCPNF